MHAVAIALYLLPVQNRKMSSKAQELGQVTWHWVLSLNLKCGLFWIFPVHSTHFVIHRAGDTCMSGACPCHSIIAAVMRGLTDAVDTDTKIDPDHDQGRSNSLRK
jgi:hypothetical protein